MSDRQFGGNHGRVYAASYLSDIVMPRLHAPTTEKIRRDLFTVSIEFALRVAAMHLDAGQTATSRRLLGVALSMAYEIEDLALTAWVLARCGEQAIHEAMLTGHDGARKHIDRAMAYTGAASSMASQLPPMARAFILTKQALSMSMTGDRVATLSVLAESWAAYEYVGKTEEPLWMKAYGWGHLRHEGGPLLLQPGYGSRCCPRRRGLDTSPYGYTAAGVLARGAGHRIHPR